MVANTTVYPPRAQKENCKKIRQASPGNRRDAGLTDYQARFGLEWYIKLFRANVEVGRIDMPDIQVPKLNNRFELPLNYETILLLSTADIDTGTWSCRVGVPDDSFYIEGPLVKSGTNTGTTTAAAWKSVAYAIQQGSSISATIGAGVAGDTKIVIACWRNSGVGLDQLASGPAGYGQPKNMPTLWTDGETTWGIWTKELTGSEGSGTVTVSFTNPMAASIAAIVVTGRIDTITDEISSRQNSGTSFVCPSIQLNDTAGIRIDYLVGVDPRSFKAPAGTTRDVAAKAATDDLCMAVGYKSITGPGAIGTNTWTSLDWYALPTETPNSTFGRVVSITVKSITTGGSSPSGGSGPFYLTDDIDSAGGIALSNIYLSYDPNIETFNFGSSSTGTGGGSQGGTGGLSESADGAEVTDTSGFLVDALLRKWSITSAGGISLDGQPPTNPDYTSRVIKLKYYLPRHEVWQLNADNLWWRWVPSNGTTPTDPNNWKYEGANSPWTGTPPPPPPPPPDPGTGGPLPTAAADGTGIDTFIRTTPFTIPTTFLGLHCYHNPRPPSYISSASPNPKSFFPYGVRRSLNYNDDPTTIFPVNIATGYNQRTWGELDAMLDRLQADGVKLLWCWYQTPRYLVNPAWSDGTLVSTFPNPAPNFHGGTTMPWDLQEVRQIAKDVVQHCQQRNPGVLIGVEVWNEPDMCGIDFFAAGALDTCYWYGSVSGNSTANKNQRLNDLRMLHKAVYLGVKDADPSVKVHGPAFSPGDHDTSCPVAYYTGTCTPGSGTYSLGTVTAGGTPKDFTDVYGGHGYTQNQDSYEIVRIFQEYVNDRNAINASWPLWNTESGNTINGLGSLSDHVQTIKRKALASAALGFSCQCYYSWEDAHYLGAPSVNSETRDALAWVASNLYPGRIVDYVAILANSTHDINVWFRDGGQARA